MSFPFIPAANFSVASGRPKDLIVVHTEESPETETSAEDVARFFARQPKNNQGTSAHFTIDDVAIVQCVDVENVAWAAPGANRNGIQLEHAGYAAQSDADWSDAYSTAMLQRSASLTAALCRQYNIPVRWVSVDDLKAGGVRGRGITSHANVSAAFHQSTHTDPGPHFPVQQYLDLVSRSSSPVVTSATWKVQPMFNPPITLQPIVATVKFQNGILLLGKDGSIYAFEGAPYYGGANGKSYFAGRSAAHFDVPNAQEAAAGKLYVIVATSGERYAYGPGDEK